MAGDICQDFCVQELGLLPCAKGSYCKNHYDCHGLFWTDSRRSAICVYSGRGDCTARHPVLCRDARTASAAVPELSTTLYPIYTAPSTTAVPATVTIPNPTAHASQWFFGRLFEAIGSVLTWTRTDPDPIAQLRARDNVLAMKLFFRSEYFSRSHPYVKVSFLNEGRRLGYYAMFDTGSDASYVFAESESHHFRRSDVPFEPDAFTHERGEPILRAAGEGQAYMLSPHAVPSGSRTLRYGIDSDIREFVSLGSIAENICVFSGACRFTFHNPRLDLVQPPGDHCRVLLGAQPESPFAIAAGAFAVVPSTRSDLSPSSEWQLLIGQNVSIHAERYCIPYDPHIRWFDLLPFTSPTWHIEGHMWLRQGVSRRSVREPGLVERIEMIIDTGGTYRVMLSYLMMDAVISEIESFGPRRIPSNNGRYPRFENCTESLWFNGDIMNLHIQPGPDRSDFWDPLNLYFKIVQDLEFHHGDSDATGQCSLKWEIGVSGAPNRVLIGTRFLSQVVTGFDRTNSRMGFCRRGHTVIQ